MNDRVPQAKTKFRRLELSTYTNLEGVTRPATRWETTCGDCGNWFSQVQVNAPGDEGEAVLPLGKASKRCPSCR